MAVTLFALFLLVACTGGPRPAGGPGPDADGDGWTTAEGDCDDDDATTSPGTAEVCDGRDQDCDGAIDEDIGDRYYADGDGDGFGDPEAPLYACAPGEGYVVDGTDCDDADGATYPGADEVCDGVDQDCDGTADEDAPDAPLWYRDADADGHGDAAETTAACDAPTGFVATADDCDDTDAAYHPGAPEDDCADPADYNCDGSVGYADADGDGWAACRECDDGDAGVNGDALETCDGRDEDCDGEVDEDDAIDVAVWYRDADGDGWGDAGVAATACEAPEGYVAVVGDCDDARAASHPDARETCDGFDDDCDGDVDEDDAVDAPTWYGDGDGDGYGDPGVTATACAAPAGYVAWDTDCDDADAGTNPDAVEDCADPVDRNCDGSVAYADADGDGWAACEECDDADPDTNPDAVEVCDGGDDDCDGVVDEDDAIDAPTWYLDGDGDGAGDPATAAPACAAPVGAVATGDDCDDADSAVYPGAVETCDGVDDDCDGVIDEDDAADTLAWHLDADADGYGDPVVPVLACAAPAGHVADATDCDDTTAAVNPGVPEDCATRADDDCDPATTCVGGDTGDTGR